MERKNRGLIMNAIQLEELKARICDDYCKYPAEYAMLNEDPEVGHEMMLEEICADCPLCELE